MSQEGLSYNWPAEAGAPIVEQHRALHEGITLLNQRMVLPEDGRLEIAYVNASGGSAKRSVLLLADTGAGKTTFVDALVGEDKRTDVKKKMGYADLVGTRNPFDFNQILDPLLSGMDPNDPVNPVIDLDELPHLPDTGDLHPLWTNKRLEVAGKMVDISRVSILGTGNFADGQRNNHLDEAMMSRWGFVVLLGDHSPEKAGEIQTRAAAMERETKGLPILPPTYAREAIGRHLDEHYVPSPKFSKYVTQLARDLTAGGLVKRVNYNDIRLGPGLMRAASAYMFWQDEKMEGYQIGPTEVARVASLVLPAYVTLSREARTRLSGDGKRESVSSFEQAIALRRVIARTAVETLIDGEGGKPATAEDRRDRVSVHMENHAYANSGVIEGYDMDEILFEDKKAANAANNGHAIGESNGRTIFGGRIKLSRR